MKSKTKQVLEMMEDLFNGKVDAFEFSFVLPKFIAKNFDDLEKENKEIAYYLNDDVPDICDEGEPGFDPTHMIEELKKVYEKVKALCK